jgi:hypothetical protein
MSNPTVQLILTTGILGMVFLMIGISFIAVGFGQLKPFDQVAFGNAEKLRSAMEQACFTERPVIVENFALPQDEVSFLVQAATKINLQGDPSYLIYYENFPIGEAISWETYLDKDLPVRYFIQINEGQSFHVSELDRIKNGLRKKINDPNAEIIISNIVLTDELNLQSLGPIENTGIISSSDALGKKQGDDFILNYVPSHLNRTLPKYLTCEPGSLCVKTPDAIRSFPLKQCGDVDHIQMQTEFVTLENRLSKDESDFYFNSPCNIDKIEVRVAKGDECVCSRYAEYPIYDYDSEKKTFVKAPATKKFCIDGITHNDLGSTDQPSKCLIIDVKDRQGGCYTYNPVTTILSDEFTSTPVKIHTKFISEDDIGNIYKLTTEEISLSITNNIKDKLQGLVPGTAIWHWPWSK